MNQQHVGRPHHSATPPPPTEMLASSGTTVPGSGGCSVLGPPLLCAAGWGWGLDRRPAQASSATLGRLDQRLASSAIAAFSGRRGILRPRPRLGDSRYRLPSRSTLTIRSPAAVGAPAASRHVCASAYAGEATATKTSHSSIRADDLVPPGRPAASSRSIDRLAPEVAHHAVEVATDSAVPVGATDECDSFITPSPHPQVVQIRQRRPDARRMPNLGRAQKAHSPGAGSHALGSGACHRAPTTTHDDPRNDEILIWVNGALTPRAEAVVSVFDSGFVLGDGVWEGLRVHDGHPAFLEQHLDRLWEGAAAMMIDVGLSREELTRAVYDTLAANGMTDGVHVRLMVTRGAKSTPYQDPRVTVGPATLVIIAEHKEPSPTRSSGASRCSPCTCAARRPDTLDPKLNSHSKLNDITACIQAYTAGADEALMLDPHGFVATCNWTHFFIVGHAGRAEVWTSDGLFCLGGITRGNVLRCAARTASPRCETTFSLTEVYSAQEAFVTGRSPASCRCARWTAGDRDGRARPDGRPAAGAVRRLVRRDVAGTDGAVTRRECAWRCGRARATSRPR